MNVRWPRWTRPVLGFVVFAVLLWLVGGAEVFEHVKTANASWFILVALGITSATLLGAVNVLILLPREIGLSFTTLLPSYWFAWAVGLVVPGQVGDLASLSISLRKKGLDWHRAIGRNLVDKAISLVLLGGLAIIGIMRWIPLGRQLGVVVIALLLAGMAFYGLCLIAWKYRKRFGPKFSAILDIGFNTAKEIRITIVQNPQGVLANVILTSVKLCLIAAAYGFALYSLRSPGLALWDLLPVVAASSLVAYVPVSINGLGTAEATGMFLFGSLGVEPAVVMAAYLLLRLLVLTIAWIPVLCWLAARPRCEQKRPLSE